MNWLGNIDRGADRCSKRSLTVGLINNASERAKKTTERQFGALLAAGFPDIDVELRSLSYEGLGDWTGSVGNPGNRLVMSGKSDLELDALIVTGMEPTAQVLQDEPVWQDFTRLVDWAEDRSVPVLWSCLAAHAAVLHMDGIVRRRLPEKLSGVYGCRLMSPNHPFCHGFPAQWEVPHSRLNDVAEDDLLAAGYDVLSRTSGQGVDLFTKDCGSVFLFAQGHPEYDALSLVAEYKRDVRRYFSGERENHPVVCANYFDPVIEGHLEELRSQALKRRDPAILVDILCALDRAQCSNSWRPQAEALYRNWLFAIAKGEIGKRARRSSRHQASTQREKRGADTPAFAP